LAVLAALGDKVLSWDDIEQYRIKDFKNGKRWKKYMKYRD
jgi:hypothetical protein